MRIEQLLSLTFGYLHGTPSISAFGRVQSDPARVGRGDLFIAGDGEGGVAQALQRGAFAILFEGPMRWEADGEVAWIEVDSLANALSAAAKYLLIENRLPLYRVSTAATMLARTVLPQAVILSADPIPFFESLINGQAPCYIADDKALGEGWSTLGERVGIEPYGLFSRTPLTMQLTLREQTRDIRLPPLYAEALAELFALSRVAHLAFSLSGETIFPLFQPVFVDARMRRVNFGGSARALLLCAAREPQIIQEQIAFLSEKFAWANLRLYLPQGCKVSPKEASATITYYENATHLREMLRMNPATYDYIAGISDPSLLIESADKPRTLFGDMI